MNKNTKTTRVNADHKLQTGIMKHLGKSGSVTVGGAKYTGAQIAEMLRERNDSLQAVDAARAEAKRVLRQDEELTAKTDGILALVRQALVLLYLGNDAVLADLGLAPKKQPRQLTAEERLAKADRMRKTREARKTMGSRQKAKVHGETTSAPEPTPATAPIVTPVVTNGAAR